MPTLLDHYDHTTLLTIGWEDDNWSEEHGRTRSKQSIVYSPETGTKYFRIYVPETPDPESILACRLRSLDKDFGFERRHIIASSEHGFENVDDLTELRFSGKVVLYTESDLPADKWSHLRVQMSEAGLTLEVRDRGWLALEEKYRRPKAFISHDSRDKKAFVRPLVDKLDSLLLPVWYDELSSSLGLPCEKVFRKVLKRPRDAFWFCLPTFSPIKVGRRKSLRPFINGRSSSDKLSPYLSGLG